MGFLFSLHVLLEAMTNIQLTIPQDAGGQRLDQVLCSLLGPDFSRAQVQRLIKEGHITLEGKTARAAQKAAAGETALVQLPDPTPLDLTPRAMELAVLYEDEHLIVINKPPNVVVHPSPGHDDYTLVHGLLYHCGELTEIGGKTRPGIVHRLDKDTSGALVAAKSDRAQRGLVTAFAAGRVDKEYLALVWGQPKAAGQNKAGIGRHPVDRKRMSTKSKHPKAAVSTWRVVRRFEPEFSLLRVKIATGRTHQIRVHLSELGHAVVGDQLYGKRSTRKLPPGPVGQAVITASRQLLHAVNLSFIHPVSRERITCLAPLPADFRLVLRELVKRDHSQL